ncbi:MAG: DoxX family protein [Rhodococcus sp.]|nr:DoxX family protein [Rhodococcus sp. (in: high G+C Gram-positive bacteria)]
MPKDPSKSSKSDGLPRTDDELDSGAAGAALPTEHIPTHSAMSEQSEQYVPGRTTVPDQTIAPDQPTEVMATPAAQQQVAGAPTAAAPVGKHERDDQRSAEQGRETDTKARRGALDLGLLCLRLIVGVTMLAHGLQKLFGLWNGPGLDGFENILTEAGFDYAQPLAVLGAIGEVAGGALLILGLLTPFAAASVLAVMINAWAFRQIAEPGPEYFAPAGTEYETLLGVCAGVIILTGPGRISLDGRRGWATRPFLGSFVVLLLGIAAGVCVWIFLNGANPLI